MSTWFILVFAAYTKLDTSLFENLGDVLVHAN